MSKAEYLVHSMHMNRLSACREFCGVHIVGKMVQDVGMVRKCCGVIDSHLVWLVFFVMLFKREERWEGRLRGMMHGQLFCLHKTNNHQPKRFQVKL